MALLFPDAHVLGRDPVDENDRILGRVLAGSQCWADIYRESMDGGWGSTF